MNNSFRVKYEKTDDGSVFVDLYGRHFTQMELEDILEFMNEWSNDDSVITGTRTTN